MAKGWFKSKPKKPGVYITSRADITRLASSYSRWTGKEWFPYNRWGGYHTAANFVWHGEGPRLREPLANPPH
jgi:hypothetical protein